ncbi:MAG: flagellar filament capping protein FliD [Planctomycetaceae bacterium]
MSGLSVGTGLISGLNTRELIDALIEVQRTAVVRLASRAVTHQTTQTALKSFEAMMLSLASAGQQLGQKANFGQVGVNNSHPELLTVKASNAATPGTYHFQAVRTAATHTVLSKGFANSGLQAVGAGTLTIAGGGELTQPTPLDALNGGQGVRRGTIRITDRSGAFADFDLATAYTVRDVVDAINLHDDLAVTASVQDGRLVLEDTSGGGGNLTVTDRGGGFAAADLGILASVAADTLSGDDVYVATGDFTLAQINDGNPPRQVVGTDFLITLGDDTELAIDLEGTFTLSELVAKINNHEDNAGKLLAELVDGRLRLTDQSGGGGTSDFAVTDAPGASVVRELGLDVAEDGGVITGNRLAAGMNSVLLRNLNGGQGIATPGSIRITDRAGGVATIDLSDAQTLDDVLSAINSATIAGGGNLAVFARIDDAGTGIVLEDTSGLGAGDLIVEDLADGTVAADLGIAGTFSSGTASSGALGLRYVNETTQLAGYGPQGKSVPTGSFRIVDSAGNQATITIGSGDADLGAVLKKINDAAGISITARLNDTGDGFVLIDEAAGAGALAVTELTGKTAAGLRLLGEVTVDGDGKQRLTSRLATVIEIDADDTLDDVAEKINAAGGAATAAVIDDGSAFASKRLSLASRNSGAAGRVIVDVQGTSLDLKTVVEGRDALLRVGADAAGGFLIANSTNSFKNAATGIDVELLAASTVPATVNVVRENLQAEATIDKFVAAYNMLIDTAAELTKFDSTTGQRGPLQGQSSVQRIVSRLDNLVNRRLFGTDHAVRSLNDLGVRVGAGGKLVFDKERLAEAIRNDPQAVADFFLTPSTGFAAASKSTLESFTDRFTGTFKLEDAALQENIDSLGSRIESLEAILASRRTQLERRFVAMENALGDMLSQQSVLEQLSVLSVRAVGTGIRSQR